MSRWITVPKYDPSGYPPISGREMQIRVAAIHSVEDGLDRPNRQPDESEWITTIRLPGHIIFTTLSADEVVALIEEAYADD